MSRVTNSAGIAVYPASPRAPEDDIVRGVTLTRGGAVVHPNFAPAAAA